MRKVLTVMVTLSVAACGPALRWEKPGADDKAIANDLTGCRRAAQVEAARDYPYFYPWAFPLGRPIYWQRAELDRAYSENRLTSFCMRIRGYVQVPVQTAPQTRAPAPPASPESQ
jgi:hypothetical protein